MRAPTPSAAAELAVFDYRILNEQLDTMRRRMHQNMIQKVNVSRMRMQNMEMKLRNLSPENRLRENRMYIAELEQRMEQLMQRIFMEKKHRVAILSERMERVSPLQKLSSGYAYVAGCDGKAVTSTAQVQRGDEVMIHVLDGRFKAEVKEIENA